MFCDYHGEYVDEDDCYNCNRNCSKNQQTAISADQRVEELKRLKGSELAEEIRSTLGKSLNLDEARIDSLICNLFDGAFKSAELQLGKCLKELAEKMAVEYIQHKAKSQLDEMFHKALGEELLAFGSNEKAQTTKIQTIILNKIKKFFEDKRDNNNRRGNTQESIDKAIQALVDEKVGDALKEITEESIEKFNKEAMKKMMAGMCGAIQNDKRLLAVLAPD